MDRCRESIVALCHVDNLSNFFKYLNKSLNSTVSSQPDHVTIYTLQPNLGIGVNSIDDMKKTIPINIDNKITEKLPFIIQ